MSEEQWRGATTTTHLSVELFDERVDLRFLSLFLLVAQVEGEDGELRQLVGGEQLAGVPVFEDLCEGDDEVLRDAEGDVADFEWAICHGDVD